jgi:DNA-binding response OmpR family regulator
MRVLVVEDETELAEALGRGLRRDGYAVDVAFDGAGALERMSYTPYDLVLLDLNLPDMDGLEVCRHIRQESEPQPRVLMLTARDALDDRVAGLDEGADDYLVKPFDFPELLARVRALLRRDLSGSPIVEVGALRLDAARHEATCGDGALVLTAKEFALLRYFMLHPGEVLTPERLLDHVWDEHADPFTNTVRVTVSNLRRKLRDAGADGVIETVVGRGYRLKDDT